MGERVKEESKQSIKKEYDAIHAVHKNVMKDLKAMLFYMASSF